MKAENSQRTKRAKGLIVTLASLAVVAAMLCGILPTLLGGGKTPTPTLRNPETTEGDDGESLLGQTQLYPAVGIADTPFGAMLLSKSSEEATAPIDVAENGTLTLTVETPTDADTLKNTLSITPMAEYTVTATSDTTFALAPLTTWEKDTVYRITVGDAKNPTQSCAFQTERDFVIKHVYPADKSTSVPVNTGIEITFTESVRKADLASFISVYPPINGSFSLYPDGKTVVIIPDESLSYNTEYAVTVDNALSADNGKSLLSGRVFRFRTEGELGNAEDTAFELSMTREYTVSPRTMPTFTYDIYTWNTKSSFSLGKTSVSAQIYKYPSMDAAQAAVLKMQEQKNDAYNGTDEPQYETDGLTLIYDGKPATEILSQNTSSLRGMLTLPAQENGCYLVSVNITVPYANAVTDKNGKTVTEHTETRQVLLQVSSLRAYTESADGNILLWVNGTDTKAPKEGVRIRATSFYEDGYWSHRGENTGEAFATVHAETVTDVHGIARMEIENDNRGILLLTDGKEELLVFACFDETEASRDLRYYIYTDREVYFSDDRVNIFGVIGKTDENSVLPKTVELRVGSQARGTKVSVAEDGTFTASFDIEAWTAYGISFGFFDDSGTALASKFVRVTQESKPVYTMELSFDRLYYTYGETVTATAILTFFDGTPAPDLELRFTASPYGQNASIKTDANGKAVYSFKAGAPRYESTSPDYLYVTAELIGYETTTLYQSESVLYFHSSGVLRTERISGTESKVYLHARDLSKIETQADLSYPDFPENTYGAPLSDTASIVLYKTEYVKTVSGTYYDPITKTTQTQYHYNTVKTREKSYTESFTDGVITLAHLDASGFDGFYSYEVSWRDPVNRHTYKQTVYANIGQTTAYTHNNDDVYSLVADKTLVDLGDQVSVTLMLGNKEAKDANALITFYYGKVPMADVQRASAYTFTFEKEHILGAALYGVIFDGETYRFARDAYIVYDYRTNNQMDMEITTDKDTYRPGETVFVTVKGAPGATVLLSLVDEACFALGEQTLLPLEAYVSSFTNGGTQLSVLGEDIGDGEYVYTYIRNYTVKPLRNQVFSVFATARGRFLYSSDMVETEAAAEDVKNAVDNGVTGGGENPVDIRETFLDNPAFVTISLDENGEGKIELPLPDNITAWRATAVGILGADNGDLSALRIGSAIGEAVCTLPYFINVSSPELFITGDEISLSARSYGATVGIANTQITYQAELYDDSGKWLASRTSTADGHEHAWFSFGTLKEGTYSVVVTGRLGESADALRVTFTVADSAFVMPNARNLTVSELSSLEILGYPLTLTFYDDTYSLYLEVLSRLAYQGTSRNDALAARDTATLAAKKFGDTGSAWYHIYRSTENAKTTLAAYDGLIPVLQHAEGDIAFSAKLLYCTPDVITGETRAELVNTFYALLATRGYADETELCALHLGLAAAGEPVLDALYNIAAAAKDYPLEAKLYLSAAFAAAGDHGAAYSAWYTICTDCATEQENTYFLAGANNEETIRNTALALLTAIRVDRTHADGMVRYLLSHTATTDLYVIELASYLTAYLPQKVEEVSFTYRFGEMEEAERVTLSGGERMTLSLTKSQLASLEITEADEALRVRASYGASADEAMLTRAESKTLKLTKTVEEYNAAQGLWLVTVAYEGVTDRDYLSFSIADCIPAGARFVRSGGKKYTQNVNSYAYLGANGSQMLTGYLSVYRPYINGKPLDGNQPYAFSGSVSYVIRGAVKGTFGMESAVAVSYDTNTYARTEALTVTIKDGTWDIKEK